MNIERRSVTARSYQYSPFTTHHSQLTIHVSRFTTHDSRLRFHVSRLTKTPSLKKRLSMLSELYTFEQEQHGKGTYQGWNKMCIAGEFKAE